MQIDKPTIEEKILKILDEQGSPLTWLAMRTGYSYSHMSNMLKGKGEYKAKLTSAALVQINKVLGTDFKL